MNDPGAHGLTRRGNVRLWLFSFLLWTVVAFIQAFQNYSGEAAEGGNPAFTRTLILQMFTWYPWALLAPLLFRRYRNSPVERLMGVRTLLWLPLTGVLCVLFEVGCHTWGMHFVSGGKWQHMAFLDVYVTMLRWLSFPAVLVFAAIVGAAHAAGYGVKFREREQRTLELERKLTVARLHALRMQIQPHFFFNTLHSIASLVRDRQDDAAVQMIARLGELFRYVLEGTDEQKVTLGAELGFLEGYLAIEQVRFSDRLRVRVDVPEALRAAAVPPLILQPIVENAVRHGIAKLSAPGEIDITARREGGTLRIEVANDGAGLSPAWEERAAGAVGIRNTRSRLEHLYGESQTFGLTVNGGGRVIASMAIPFEQPGVPGEGSR